MYSGNNPTALKSREMIVTAMFKLLATTPYEKITVRQLAEAAKVSRQTFYAIFNDRDEVIECRIEAVFVAYQQALSEQPLTIRSLVQLFFTFYEKQATLFNLLLDNHLESLLTANARRCLQKLQLTAPAAQVYVNGFMAAGLTQILADWYRAPNVTLSELVNITVQLLNPQALVARQ